MGEAVGGPRVGVIGAGIVGVSAALHLQREGAAVIMLDSAGPGGGASYGNAGAISVDACVPVAMPGMLKKVPGWLSDPLGPLAVDPRYFPKALPWLLRWAKAGRMESVLAASDALRALHRGGLDAYRAMLGPERYHDLVRASGQLYVWEGGDEGQGERITREIWNRHAIEADTLDPAELRQLVPEISPAITRAVFMRNNGFTTNPLRLVRGIAELAREAGAELHHESALKIVPENGAGYRIVTNLGQHRVDKLVVAAGAWSKRLLQPLGIKIPLETERGYHAMIASPGIELKLPILHKSRGFAATPMENGLRLAGTVEIAGLDRPMNEARAKVLIEQGRKLFPRLEARDFKMWMGFRPSLPDSVPVIDRAASHAGIFIACGHGHTGITAGGVTGRLVSELVLGRSPSLDLAPYRLSRFD